MSFQDIYVIHEWRLVKLQDDKGWSIVNNDGIVGSSYFPTSEIPAEIVEAHNKALYHGMREELLTIYQAVSNLSA